MGLRMYCKEVGDKREYFHDNESPKFYGYVSEKEAGESWKYLKEIQGFDEDQYDYLFICESNKYTLLPEEFNKFITLFIQDLKNNSYELRQSWLNTMGTLKHSAVPKIIWWS